MKKINVKTFEILINKIDKKYEKKQFNIKFILFLISLLSLISIQAIKINIFVKIFILCSILFIIYKILISRLKKEKNIDFESMVQNHILSSMATNLGLVYFPFSKFKMVDFINTIHFGINPNLISSSFSFDGKIDNFNITIGNLELFKTPIAKNNSFSAKLKKSIDKAYNKFYELIGSENYEKNDELFFNGLMFEAVLNFKLDYKIAIFPKGSMLTYGVKKVDFEDENYIILSDNESRCFEIITPEIFANFIEISSVFESPLKLSIENNKIFISSNEGIDLTKASDILRFQDLAFNVVGFIKNLKLV